MHQLVGPDFGPHGPTDASAVRARVQQYEAISEGLVSVAGVFGRWRDGTELPLVLDLIRALYAHAEKVGSGLVFFWACGRIPHC